MKKINNMLKKSCKYVPFLMILTLLYTDVAFAEDKNKGFITAWTELMKEYNVIVSSVVGLSVLTSLLIFIIHMMQLASSSNNAVARSAVLKNVLISGICTALLGGIGLIYMLVYTSVF